MIILVAILGMLQREGTREKNPFGKQSFGGYPVRHLRQEWVAKQ
jgi:hypothetical protein